ncbi:MAG: glycosyltransferase family 2 protein [Lentisphaerae bacterium]|nr:glycosyltransferase family 2 protein [Lentisphaerota bacterium]
MANPIFLSVCVPALNEAPTLRESVDDLLQNLAPAVGRLEIIIVNDGSQDDTGRIAEALAAEHAGIRVLHHAQNMGFGATYRDALAAATGDFFTWFPSDHENLASELVQEVAHVAPGVIVMSQHVDTDPRPLYRRLPSRLYTRSMNRIFGLQVRYYNGLTIYPTADLRAVRLVAQGFVMQAEAVVKVAKRGLRIVELEHPLGKRTSGRSALVSGRAFRQALRDARRIWLARQK